jgi:putative flippase GtrA
VLKRPWQKRFLKYALGSGLATLTSAAAFAIVYHIGNEPRVASVVAFASGAVVNFIAGRFWAWERRARPGLGRDVVSFAVISVVSALAAAGVTSLTHSALTDADPDTRAVLVEASYFATYAVLFMAKFLLLDRLVFRSRHQVPNTTRV